MIDIGKTAGACTPEDHRPGWLQTLFAPPLERQQLDYFEVLDAAVARSAPLAGDGLGAVEERS